MSRNRSGSDNYTIKFPVKSTRSQASLLSLTILSSAELAHDAKPVGWNGEDAHLETTGSCDT